MQSFYFYADRTQTGNVLKLRNLVLTVKYQ